MVNGRGADKYREVRGDVKYMQLEDRAGHQHGLGMVDIMTRI